ncbi:DNA polymerase IV [Gloeobacter kilaueensis]|uniref:DNA polymerase IV n=1 Tax=Gloeobacter kilaueensis (strain ATCC BAA-2537 / CCAP 1431/1 / ULC 316 / JS1) TaxID=1183438 RepID=U5QJQ5_GLOK1|nr:DNA polymerase IV [Gloeobacter kilaueensis]AGY59161.1 DNA polymerase IV [Gloeobacter kilaueensis JS1]
MSQSAVRKVIHVDMDAFFASVEQRDNPEYRGKPLVVGGTPAQRGAVAAASYEARHYGIHSAMPSRIAIQRCRHLLFVPPRFEVYRAVSREIQAIFARYTELMEPVSLDEAYLDVTENKPGFPSATWIAQQIKADILAETELTASAGVSCNKFLAKMASGIDKPNGLYVLLPEMADAFTAALPIEKFHGIGAITAQKMQRLGIHTGADLRQWPVEELVRLFGKSGRFYYQICRGVDERAVNPHRERKSIGVETSFLVDLEEPEAVVRELEKLVVALKERADTYRAVGHTLTLKLKYANYRQLSRSRTVTAPIKEIEAIRTIAQELLVAAAIDGQKVRLLGLYLSGLQSEDPEAECVQLKLGV